MEQSPLDKIYTASKMLFNSMPFYGILSLRVRKVLDNTIKTACVRLGSDNFSMEMAFSPEWIKDMSVEHVRGVIEHELSHAINGHLIDKMYTHDGINHEIMNVAMDCEINQYIDARYLPEGITLAKVSSSLGISLPHKAGTMTYYDLLIKEQQKGKVKVQGGVVSANGTTLETMDQHNIINNSAGQAVLEGIVESAAEETVKRRGTVPGAVEQMLKLLHEKRKPVIDWKTFLRRFVQNSYKEYVTTTRRRESRRYDDNPGLRHEPEFTLMVGIDSSGSVSDSELKEFLQEIDNIHKNKCEVRIVVCDTRIVQDFTYKGKKESIKIAGRGGTSFEPVLDLYEKSRNNSCLVYFTDGECYVERRLKKPVLWVISSQGTDHYLKDCKTVKMEKQNNK